MHIDWLYSKIDNSTAAYIYEGMTLKDKLIYPGKLDREEQKKHEERIKATWNKHPDKGDK